MLISVILFGFHGVGKTTLGRAWALAENRPFIDTDEEIEKEYLEETGKKLFRRDMYTLDPAGFREREKRIIKKISPAGGKVIAAGGGAVLCPETAEELRKIGRMIYLCDKKEVLKERILRRGIPAFLNPDRFEESFESIYREREVIYRKYADLTIDLSVPGDHRERIGTFLKTP